MAQASRRIASKRRAGQNGQHQGGGDRFDTAGADEEQLGERDHEVSGSIAGGCGVGDSRARNCDVSGSRGVLVFNNNKLSPIDSDRDCCSGEQNQQGLNRSPPRTPRTP
jgi:hypothetical protein